MNLDTIKLTNFRNYEKEKFQFHQEVNILVGRNGVGKTNLLDAIYYLCIGKSYFNARDIQNVKYDTDFFRIEGRFEKKDLIQRKMVIKWGNGKKKSLELDDVKIKKHSDHIGQFPVIIIAPKDILLLIKGSEERRKFMDSTISQYDSNYLNGILLYSRLIKQRNAALKHFKESNKFDQSYIDTIDIQILPVLKYIYETRTIFAIALNQTFARHYRFISGGSETCSCTYQSQLIDKSYQELCDENKAKDKVLCRSSSGIHKDDLSLKIEGHKLQDHGSQGQIKSAVLALKLAQYTILKQKKNTTPLLLLDDLFDKLDNSRVGHLLDLLLTDEYGQIFITDTGLDRIPDILQERKAKFSTFVIK